MTLLRMTLSGTILILLVCVFRLLFKDRVHRSVFPALWTLISLRMLIPYYLPVKIKVSENSQISNLAKQADTIQSAVARAQTSVEASVPSLADILLIIWLVGAVVCLLVFLGSHLRSILRYRFSLPIPSGKIKAGKLRVRMLDGLDGPLTYGIFRPTILLPTDFDWSDKKTLRHILMHEKTHIRYLDLPRKALLILVTALHWFNPFAWLMLRLAALDMEIRCDAVAVRQLGKSKRKAYAKTLVNMEQQRFDFLQAGFSFNDTLTRLKALSKAKISGRISRSIALALSAFVAICCLAPTFSTAAPLKQVLPAVFGPEFIPNYQPVSYTEAETESPSVAAQEETAATEENDAAVVDSAQAGAEYSSQSGYQNYGHDETILLPDSFTVEETPTNQTNSRNSSSYDFSGYSYAQNKNIYDINSIYQNDPNYVYVIPIYGSEGPHYVPRDSVGPQPCIPGYSYYP